MSETQARRPAIDQFRGLAILLMLPVNYMEHIKPVPAWLKHAPDVGITIADFVAPFFVFAIGLTYRASVRRRITRDGLKNGLEHVIKRGMALIGIGALFSIGETLSGFNPHGPQWGTLQAIGTAILLTLPVLWMSAGLRLGLALSLLTGYQWLVQNFWLETVIHSSHAGIQGSLSWGALLMLATVYADLEGEPRRYFRLALSMLCAGLVLALWFPVSKHRMSISFDLVVSASAALVYRSMDSWVRLRGPIARLALWGRNPLALYLSHLFLLSVFLIPETPWWHFEAPPLLALVQGVAFVALLDRWARWLDARGIIVSL